MRILLAIAVGALLVAVVPGPAQDANSLSYQIDIDKNERGENRVLASFREHNGKQALYVTVHFRVRRVADGRDADVDTADIVIREDGHKVHDLEIFSPHTALNTVLAMDISGSMDNTSGVSGVRKIDEAKNAAGIFLDNLSPNSEVGLILFDHLMRLEEPPRREAASYAEHRGKIRGLIKSARPMGGTAYLDAAAKAVEMLKDITGRRAVVLMTDGVDMNSKRTVGEVIKRANVYQVPIYTLGIGELGKYKNVTTVLVLDHSGSMNEKADVSDQRTKIEALRTAASRFVELMRRDAKTALQPFSSEVDDVPSNFTDDKQYMIQRIKELQPDGGTSLYDATFAGLETLAAGRREGRNAVVVLTDGRDEDPGSRVSAQLVIDRAKELKYPLYMLGLGQKDQINEAVMKRMAQETGGKYFHAGNEQKLFDIFENLSIDLHDDGINEKELRELAEKTGGKFFWARDAAKLPGFFRDLASELQATYTVTFASRRSSHDGTARGIDISIEHGGVRLSNVGSADYTVHGVVVPEMDYRIYLALLALLGVFLLAPVGVRQLYRFYGGT
jgi:Mg-chelatase subunit ChlD